MKIRGRFEVSQNSVYPREMERNTLKLKMNRSLAIELLIIMAVWSAAIYNLRGCVRSTPNDSNQWIVSPIPEK